MTFKGFKNMTITEYLVILFTAQLDEIQEWKKGLKYWMQICDSDRMLI